MRSRVHRFLFPSLASVVVLAFACGQDATVEDPPTPIDSGPSGDATNDAPADGNVAEAAPDVVCPEVLPDDATGVYVTPAGINNVGCGTRAAPCKTVGLGITHAAAASRAKVYVARGTYVEQVTLAAGVEVVGGWDVPAGSTKWKRTCVTPEQIVVLRAPPNQHTTVEATDLGGEAGLSLLRIESKVSAAVAPGESLYGIRAVGATTTVVVNDVDVEVGNGGAGASTPNAPPGAPAPPTCPAGAGAPGAPGAHGPGAALGSFISSGYQPAVGGAGTPGAAGDNGTAGVAGTCVACGACTPFPACTFVAAAAPPACGKDGAPGCAGGAAGPGEPAAGGGSSIGIFAWDATVAINGGKIKSGDGGNGGSGGAGGAGGTATLGVVGAPTVPCVTSCAAGLLACVETKTAGLGGAAGGPGGGGGAGGAGGGGGGGWSVGFYQGNAGLITFTPSTKMSHGKAGAGGGPVGGAGAAGAATDHVP